jgi:signal transduction histidine kinase
VGSAKLLPIAKPEKHESLIRIILNAGNRATDLIKSYLDVSEVECGKVQLEIGPVEPRTVVDNEMEFLSSALKDRMGQITLVNQVQPASIMADGRKLGQIFANLISNAIKYSPAGGQVTVEAEYTPQEATFRVRDQGVGISAEDQERLFGAFQRVGDRSIAPGTGLGLWLVAALIEAHGGRIGVTSTPGKGSTFYFTLPR